MTWRNHTSHKEETKAVKKALNEAGINATVRHGTGTAWSWLEINIGAGQQFGEHDRVEQGIGCYLHCPVCENMRAMEKRTMEIVREVTGRSGENVLILRQHDWSDKRYKETGDGNRPICHPNWKPTEQGGDNVLR